MPACNTVQAATTRTSYASIRSRIASSPKRTFAAASTSTSTSTSASHGRPRRASSRQQPSTKPGSDLVGPPDPKSNLRPVIYGSAFQNSASSSSSHQPSKIGPLSHPYSTSEFSSSAPDHTSSYKRPHSHYFQALRTRLEIAEMQHHLRRVRSDRFSQNFWADNNARYDHDMAQYRSSRSSTAGGTKGQEDLLAPFNAAWLDANSQRHKAYNDRLWAMTREDLMPALRYSVLRSWVGWVAWLENKLGRGGTGYSSTIPSSW